MPEITYPIELTKAFWDKKKVALEGAPDLVSALKTMEKKHEAVAWASFMPGWVKAASGDPAKLKLLFEAIDKQYRAKVSPLRLEAQSLASLADKAGKAKEATKPLKDAYVAIAKAAMAYGKLVSEGLDTLEKEFEQTAKAMPQGASKGEADDEPASALVDPKRLRNQLMLCKADAKRQVNFAMLDDGKQDPVLVLHPSTSGRAMLAKLGKDLGINKGAHGQLSLNDEVLQLVVDKKVAGLAKRIRIPIRLCGFKIGKVVQLDEQGVALEEDLDLENGSDVAPTVTSDTSSASLALQEWSKAREAAIHVLKEAAQDIAALKDPESTKAIIELNAVIKNLTAEPRSKAQVAELIRYIDKDDVVHDVSDYANDIRTPLLKVLTVLAKVAS